MNKFFLSGLGLFFVAACQMSTPEIEHASENTIAIRYTAWDIFPTLTAEAIEIAVSHCEKFGRFANYRGANAPNAFSAEEIHVFVCERTKTDDNAVIAAQNKRYTDLYNASLVITAPTVTNCTTYGTYTSCTSY